MEGYAYGKVPASPVTAADLEGLKASLLFTAEDEKALAEAGEVLEDQIEEVLDVWYGFVGAHPHLVAYFSTPEGQPIPDYLARVRARFGQWIRDTCQRPYDTDWLAWQQEIGLRHTRAKKNVTDNAPSLPHIPLRHVIAFIYPISATMRPFLEKGGHSADEVEAMWQAWFKAVTLQVALWSRAYCAESDW